MSREVAPYSCLLFTIWLPPFGGAADAVRAARDEAARRGAGAIWTLNQGGEFADGMGRLGTTLAKVLLSAALWLTDYHGGTVSQLDLRAVVKQCRSAPPSGSVG